MSHRCCSKFLLFVALASTPSTLFTQAPAVQVQVYDYADTKVESVHKVLALTQEILAGAGLSIRVILCRPDPVVSCASQSEPPKRLVVRVAPGGPKTGDSVLRPPLGLSIAGSEGGTLASVFVSRVKNAAADVNVPWDIVLAYAIAHEVGHLLLGAEAHTPRGLMKGTWGREEYLAMYQRRFHFTDEQSRQLASRYGSAPVVNAAAEPAAAQPR
jgi:hypothetical protein